MTAAPPLHAAMRRFWLPPDAVDEFERISREQIWPNAQAAGLRIRALLRAESAHPPPTDDVPADAAMLILFTDYADQAHLAMTRAPSDDWRGPERLRRRNLDGIQARQALCYASDLTHLEPSQVGIGIPHKSFGNWEPSAAAAMPAVAEQQLVDGAAPLADGGLIVLRRFWLARRDAAEFERLSVHGVWPAIEAEGARIRALYRAAEPHPNEALGEAAADAIMIVLLTHYTGVDHWRATRVRADTWRGPARLRAAHLSAARSRQRLVLASEGTFTRSARVPVDGPFFVFQHDQD